MVDYTYAADKDTAATCSSCHSIARVLGERRTKEEWELLVAMHRGWYYPLVDNQPMSNVRRRRTRPLQTEPGEDGRLPDNRHPMDKALEHLAKALPLKTSDWSTWSAAMQSPKLAGKWAITGTALGQGPVYGQVTITADPSASDTFTTETRYIIARTGETMTRTGKALIYRGTSGAAGAPRRAPEVVTSRGEKRCSSSATGRACGAAGIRALMTRPASTRSSCGCRPNRSCSAPT